jgi:hypothetical protein
MDRCCVAGAPKAHISALLGPVGYGYNWNAIADGLSDDYDWQMLSYTSTNNPTNPFLSHPDNWWLWSRVLDWVRAHPGRVYLLLNEPNGSAAGGGNGPITPEQCAELLDQWQTDLKNADPSCVLVGPNLAQVSSSGFPEPREYMRRILEWFRVNGKQLKLNVFSYHAYGLQPKSAGVLAQVQSTIYEMTTWRDFWLQYRDFYNSYGVLPYMSNGKTAVTEFGPFAGETYGSLWLDDYLRNLYEQMAANNLHSGPYSAYFLFWFLCHVYPGSSEPWTTMLHTQFDPLDPSGTGPGYMPYKRFCQAMTAGGYAADVIRFTAGGPLDAQVNFNYMGSAATLKVILYLTQSGLYVSSAETTVQVPDSPTRYNLTAVVSFSPQQTLSLPLGNYGARAQVFLDRSAVCGNLMHLASMTYPEGSLVMV